MKANRLTMLLQNQVVALVLLLLFVVPLLFAGPDVSRTNQITAYGFLGLLLLIVWLLRSRDRLTLPRVRAFVLSGPNLPIILYVAWSFFALRTSIDRFYSELTMIQLAFGVLLYGVVVYQFRQKEQVRALLCSLLVLGVVVVLSAFASGSRRGLLDLTGTFHDRQLFGSFLLLLLPVLAGIAAGTRNRLWKGGTQLACILVAGALVLTRCRSAWIGGAVAFFVFLVLGLASIWKWRGLDQRKHDLLITPVLGLVVLSIFIGFTRLGGPIQWRAATLTMLNQDPSVVDRLNLWGIAGRVIAARPWTGWGPGTYALAQARFAPETRSEAIITQMGPSLHESPHNTYLQIAGEQGLPGLGLYLAVLAMFFYTGLRALSRMDRGLRKYTLIGCLAAVAGQCVDGLANPGWMYPEVSTFFWLVLGMGMCAAGLGQESVPEESSTAETPVLGMPRFLFRGVRTAALGCAVLLAGAHLLSMNVPEASAGAPPAPGGGGGGGAGHRPIYCDFIRRLDVDFLNDDIPPPDAFNINSGAIYADRLAVFQVYALTDDPRFFANVTTEKKQIRFKLIGLKGKISYSDSSSIPRFFYTPHRSARGKTGTIEISYRCTRPREVFTTRFTLTVLPNQDVFESPGQVGGRSEESRRLPGLVAPFDWSRPELLLGAETIQGVEQTD